MINVIWGIVIGLLVSLIIGGAVGIAMILNSEPVVIEYSTPTHIPTLGPTSEPTATLVPTYNPTVTPKPTTTPTSVPWESVPTPSASSPLRFLPTFTPTPVSGSTVGGKSSFTYKQAIKELMGIGFEFEQAIDGAHWVLGFALNDLLTVQVNDNNGDLDGVSIWITPDTSTMEIQFVYLIAFIELFAEERHALSIAEWAVDSMVEISVAYVTNQEIMEYAKRFGNIHAEVSFLEFPLHAVILKFEWDN